MNTLVRIFGWPHELLHVLALRLIGRRPHTVRQTHVDIPDDLSMGEFVFVAGLPALVFTLATAISMWSLWAAQDVWEVLLWLILSAFFALGITSTAGDLLLIAARLAAARLPKDH